MKYKEYVVTPFLLLSLARSNKHVTYNNVFDSQSQITSIQEAGDITKDDA